MTLVTLNLNERPPSVPLEVRRFLREADTRIERFQRDSPVPGFVPSEYERAYSVLQQVAEGAIAPGDRCAVGQRVRRDRPPGRHDGLTPARR